MLDILFGRGASALPDRRQSKSRADMIGVPPDWLRYSRWSSSEKRRVDEQDTFRNETMSRPTDNNTPLSLDMIDEDRVRRALGLKTGSGATTHQQRPEQARQRHRFVTDGSVPVVMLNRSDSETSGLKERLSAAEHALESERNAHAATRRSLQEAQQAQQSLQTRLSHTELSQNDVLRAERDGRRDAEERIVALREEIAQLKLAPVAPLKTRREIKAVVPIVRQKRLAAAEPKPVRWWTPSYRAKQS